jgi:hypothetical protein
VQEKNHKFGYKVLEPVTRLALKSLYKWAYIKQKQKEMASALMNTCKINSISPIYIGIHDWNCQVKKYHRPKEEKNKGGQSQPVVVFHSKDDEKNPNQYPKRSSLYHL